MAFMRAKMKSSLVIVLALGCGILAVFWPQWRGELRAQGYYPGFGAEGKVTTAFEDLAQARAVAIQADGKIVAAGYAVLSGNQHFALVRYNTDGTLDSSFGTGGKVTTDFFGFGRVNALAIQVDGKIVAAGAAVVSNQDFALARFNTDGTLDTSFGAEGMATTDFLGDIDTAFAVAIQPDARIVAAGYASTGSGEVFALARYDSGLTPLDLATALSARVQDFVNAGILNPGQGNSLSSKLTHVVQSLNLGEINTACNQLRAFINEVDALISSGVLTSAQGEPLIGAATGIRTALGCR